MKKILYLIIAIVNIFCLSSEALAAYAIKLKNGHILQTSKIWEEKDSVKFSVKGGTISISKKIIDSIEMIKDNPESNIPISEEDIAEPAAILPNDEKDAEQKTGKEKIDINYYKKQKSLITEEYEQAYTRYLEASSRKDLEAKKKAWEEFNHYGTQYSALEEELKKKNQGVLPKWWNE